MDPACHGMGTTAVGLRFEENLVHICHCGDSRAYLLRHGQLQQLTRDHSLRNLYQDRPDLIGTLGPTTSNVIIRAIGPSLSVPGKLMNPTLELRDQNGGLINANDNWVDSPDKQAIMDTSIAPTSDLESAIIALLPSGGAQYTAIVRGVSNTTGIAVVEVYALQ
jgi:protein phosphatase